MPAGGHRTPAERIEMALTLRDYFTQYGTAEHAYVGDCIGSSGEVDIKTGFEWIDILDYLGGELLDTELIENPGIERPDVDINIYNHRLYEAWDGIYIYPGDELQWEFV